MATPNQLDSLFIPDEEQKEDEAQSSKNLFIPDEVSQETQERPENLFIPDEDVQAPSRAGAIGRTVAEELIPTTVAGLTARGLGTLPVPAVPKFLLGATGAILSYGAAGRLQEEAAKKIAGEKAVEEFKAQRQRDIAEYPVSTFAASVATPTAGGIAALGRRGLTAAGQAVRGAFTRAEAVAPKVEEAVAPKIAEEVVEQLPVQQELPLGGIAKTSEDIAKERAQLIANVEAQAEPGQKISKFAERLIASESTSDDIAKAIADNRSLYNTFSPKGIAENLRKLSPQQINVFAQSDDLVGKVAKQINMNQSFDLNDIPAAKAQFLEVRKGYTNAGQLLNVAKLAVTNPLQYAFTLERTLEAAARGYATRGEKAMQVAEAAKQLTPKLEKEAITLFRNKQVADEAMREAYDKARIDFSKKADQLAEQRQSEALLASGKLAEFESGLLAKRLGMQIPDYIRGNLLTTLSQGANILGNTVNMPARAATRQVASFLDQIERNIIRPVATRIPGVKSVAEKYLAKERQFMSPLGRGSLERFIEVGKGGGRGLREGVTGLKIGISPEGLLASENIRGFRPLNAWKQLFTGRGLAEPIAEGIEGTAAKVMDRARLLAEGTLGIAPEVMFRLLQLGDTPARRMAQARLLTEARQLEGLKGKALRRAVKYPTQLEADKVASEVAEAVYQQDTRLSRGIQYLADLAPKYLEKIPGVGRPLAGIARTATTAVLPYQKTPTNVIDEILQYSIPEYSFIRGLAEQGQGNFRQAKLQFAKSIVGYAIGNIADILSRAGVITDTMPKSDKARDVQFQAAPSQMINIDGVKRFLQTGSRQEMEPGDSLRSLERLGVVGAIVSTRNAANQATEGGTGSLGEAWGATLPETLKFGFNQSFLRNMNSLLGTISRGEAKDMDAWLANYYGALSAAVLPNQLTSVSRYMSENMPDKIQVKDIEGGDFATKSYNIFKEVVKRKWPKSTDDLPAKINVWGEPVPQTPEGVDPFIYNFIDPTRPRKVTYDDVTLAVYDLYKKTGKTDGIPQVPDRDLRVLKRRTGQRARFRLDPLLYEEYASAVGKANRKVAEQLLGDKRFRRLIPEEQVKTLSSAYNKASKTARENFIRKNQRSIEFGQEL
jgi:hypothetical protein